MRCLLLCAILPPCNLFRPQLAWTLSTLGDLSVNAYPLRFVSGEGKDSCSERVAGKYLSHEVNALEEPEWLANSRKTGRLS